MQTDDEIHMAQSHMEAIEEYVTRGVWYPDRQIDIARMITEVDMMLDQLMMGHSLKEDVLTDEQTKVVSNLLKRLSAARDKLPSPPM